MDVKVKKGGCASQAEAQKSEKEMGNIRKGPWTADEDTILVNYMATHGEGRWNSVARCSGLKRSGKSCRLRWLNYLRPDVRRGNITLQEQILILDLHSRWGNRWSKIAQHLPGRTDNEIKNYWRTRVIKQAKQLKCDVNSKQFKDAMRYVWIPRLLERVRPTPESLAPRTRVDPNPNGAGLLHLHQKGLQLHSSDWGTDWLTHPNHPSCGSGTSGSSYSSSVEFHSHTSELLGHDVSDHSHENGSELCPNFNNQILEQENGGGGGGGDSLESLWNEENMWFLQQQLCDDPEIKYNFLA